MVNPDQFFNTLEQGEPEEAPATTATPQPTASPEPIVTGEPTAGRMSADSFFNAIETGASPSVGPPPTDTSQFSGPISQDARDNLGLVVDIGSMASGIGAGLKTAQLVSKIPQVKKLSKFGQGAAELLASTLGFELGSQPVQQGAQLAGLIPDTPLEEDLKTIRDSTLISILVPAAAKPVGKALGSLFQGAGTGLKALGNSVTNLLDKDRALSRAFADSEGEFALWTGRDSIATVVQNLKPLVQDIRPDKRGEIFKHVFNSLDEQVDRTGEAIDGMINLGRRRLVARGIDPSVSFGEIMDMSQFEQKLKSFVPAVDKKVFNNILEEESDNIASHVLTENDFFKYKAAKRALSKFENEVGAWNLFKGSRIEAESVLTEKQLVKGASAFTTMELTRSKIAKARFDMNDIKVFKRRFGANGKYKTVAGQAPAASEVTRAEVYRGFEGAFRKSLAGLMREAGPDASRVFTNMNTRYSALQRAMPLADIRQSTEARQIAQFLPAKASLRGSSRGGGLGLTDLISVPPSADLAIAQGRSSLKGSSVFEDPLKMAGATLSGPGRAISAIEEAITFPRAGAAMQSVFELEQDAQALEQEETLRTRSDETGIALEEFESVAVEGKDVYVDDRNEQNDILSEYRFKDGIKQGHIYKQASRWNDNAADNLLLPVPKPAPTPKPKAPTLRKQTEGTSTYRY